MTSRPRFSIVIPTRDRPHTLRWTLETCFAQEFDSCEFLVSDNSSSDETREIVDLGRDSRLKYVRTPAPLAMTDSWDFAVSRANGEFITIVGDDDGLLLHALPEIDRILSTLHAKVLRWESASYAWPCAAPQPGADPGRLLVPLKQSGYLHPIRRRLSVESLRAAARLDLGYWQFPMIYNSMVHRAVLESLRARTGRVFHSRSPDVYSAYAIGCVAGEFYSADAPMAVSGTSGKSNGAALILLKEKSDVANDFSRLNATARIAWHARAIQLPTLSAIATDSFLCARDLLFSHDEHTALDYRRLITQCLRELPLDDEAEWRRVLAAVREGIAGDGCLLGWFDDQYGALTFAQARLLRQPSTLKRYGDTYLNLNGSDFGVTNVFEAAELCEKLLGYRRDGTNSHFVGDVRVDGITGTAQADNGLIERTAPGLLQKAKARVSRLFWNRAA